MQQLQQLLSNHHHDDDDDDDDSNSINSTSSGRDSISDCYTSGATTIEELTPLALLLLLLVNENDEKDI